MSKFTLNTTALQNAVTKAIKGAGFNKLIDTTSWMGILKFGDTTTLITSDGTNYLYVYLDVTCDDDFSIVVDADMFARLVAKLTTETVDLEVTNDALIVRGNGEYKLSLKLDDNGENKKYPNPYITAEITDDVIKVNRSVIDVMLTSIKPSLSTTEGNIYSKYYVGDIIVGTDRSMFSSFDNGSFTSNRLLTREFVDLLGLMSDDIEMSFGKSEIIAKSGNMLLYAKNDATTEGFQKDSIVNILSVDMDSYCKVNKQALLSTLERIAIFVGEFDDTAVKLNFTKDGLQITSLNTSGVETVDYLEHKFNDEFSAKISITRFITLLKSYGSDSVDIYFGNAKMLKLKDGKLTQVIAYML